MKLRIGIAAFAASVLMAGTAFANPNSLLRGTYSEHSQGTTWNQAAGGSPIKRDFVTTGIVSADGQGNFSGVFTITYSATFFAAPEIVCVVRSAGTYSLATNGSGTSHETETVISGPCDNTANTFALSVSPTGNSVSAIITEATDTSDNGNVIVSVVDTVLGTKD